MSHRVVVLTTSYPRFEGDAAGRFVADAVERLREHVEVDVVSAQSFRHFGIAYGHGVLGRSEEHTSELQSLPTISYAVFCLKKKK